MGPKKDRYPQVGPRDWMNRNGWYAKEGGVWEKDSKGKINTPTPKGVSVGTTTYQDWEHRPVSKKKLTKQEQEIEELRRQQANTTPIGYQPNVQQYIRNQLANRYPILANTIGYPVVAAARMTDPTYSYTQGQSGYAAFPGAGQAIIDAESVLPVARGIYNTLPTPKVPKGYSGPMLTDLVPEELPLHPGTNFPVGYIKRNVKGNTPMPYMTEVPTLNKEQQILQSFGLDPFVTKKPLPPTSIQKDVFTEEGISTYDNRAFVTPNPYGKGEPFKVGYKAEYPHETEYYPVSTRGEQYPVTAKEWYSVDPSDYLAGEEAVMKKDVSKGVEDVLNRSYNQYIDFGIKTPFQRMINAEQGRKDQIPESLLPTVRQQNKYGGSINIQDMKKKYEHGGYHGVLPQVMPGMYPGNIPIVMNQHATEPMYVDVPAYAHGGFYQKPGYFYNGHSMVKNKGTGTYSQDGYYFERGGYPHPLNTPFDTFEMGGYTHPLDVPFDEFKKGGIHIKPENRGKFNALKKRTGKTTEELTHSKNPLTRKRAIFAQNAAKWKHEMGGPVNPFHPLRQFAQGGVTDENPIGGATTFTGENPAGMSTTAPTQNSYDPSTDANNPVNQNLPMPQQGGYAAAQEGVWDETGTTDAQPEEDQDMQAPMQTKRNGALNWGSAILGVGTGILGAASMLHDKYQNRKVQQQWIRDQNKSDNLPTMINSMSKGTYDQFGNMPYNNMSQSPNIRTMKNGGYVKGSTHELSEQEINNLLRQGYKIQRL